MTGFVTGVTGMDQAEVIEIAHGQGKRIFTLAEAKDLLPVVRKVTARTATEVEKLLQQLENSDINNTAFIEKTEMQVNHLIQQWNDKMAKLGVKSKGLWYVDFDNGVDFFCWRYPEQDIFFQHSHTDGFTGRTLIDKSRPLPADIQESADGHFESEKTWVESSTRPDQLTPWRL